MRRTKILTATLAAVLALATFDAAIAKRKTQRVYTDDREAAFWSGLTPRGRTSTPAIMKGTREPKAVTPAPDIETPTPMRRSDRPSPRRGSGDYIPPPVPSPNSANNPPPAALVTQPVQPYKPPPINSFGDRATNAIHDFPLQGGLGNNPNNLQGFIRQRGNQ